MRQILEFSNASNVSVDLTELINPFTLVKNSSS